MSEQNLRRSSVSFIKRLGLVKNWISDWREGSKILPIPRLHFIELHEQEWCPAVLRHGLRAVLQQISSTLPGYEAIVDELLSAMEAAGTTEVLDLCAGAGGPWKRLAPYIDSDPRITRIQLTDLFPDLKVMQAMRDQAGSLIEPCDEPVDALAVPPEKTGFRTIFAAFHHFEPARARAVIADAVSAGEGVGIFELSERRLLASVFVGLTAFPLAMGLMPLIRPVRWAYFPLTYLLPAIPAILTFDGLVSCMRTYHPAELLEIAREVAPDYEWKAGRKRAFGGPLAIIYLTGVPPKPIGA